eukprot:TRINITY_DN61739_c0_g1_i1.p1 TRINITY_DN61739_c0_g1~~TRINITY_DN61739_c0_g1_i1.p1  ORF type:complete len:706 (+),score=84.91 TRINITY_DN61739_c0_g1_i1:231-2348(+)
MSVGHVELFPCWDGVFTFETCCLNSILADRIGCWASFGGLDFSKQRCCDFKNSILWFNVLCWGGNRPNRDFLCKYNLSDGWNAKHSPPITHETCCAPKPWKPPSPRIGLPTRQASRVKFMYCGPLPNIQGFLRQLQNELGWEVIHRFNTRPEVCFPFYHWQLQVLSEKEWMLEGRDAAVVILSPYTQDLDVRKHMSSLAAMTVSVLRWPDIYPVAGFAVHDRHHSYWPVRKILHGHWKLSYAKYHTGYDRWISGGYKGDQQSCFGGDSTSGSRVYAWKALHELLPDVDPVEDASWYVSLDLALKKRDLTAFTCIWGFHLREEDYLARATLPDVLAKRYQVEVARYLPERDLVTNCFLSHRSDPLHSNMNNVTSWNGYSVPYCYRVALNEAFAELSNWWVESGKCRFQHKLPRHGPLQDTLRQFEDVDLSPPSILDASRTFSGEPIEHLVFDRLTMPPCGEAGGRHVVIPQRNSGTSISMVRNTDSVLPWESDVDVDFQSFGVAWIDIFFLTEITARFPHLVEFRKGICDALSEHTRNDQQTVCRDTMVMPRMPAYPLSAWARQRTLDAVEALLPSWQWAFVNDYRGGGSYFVFQKVTHWDKRRVVTPHIDVIFGENLLPEEAPLKAQISGADVRIGPTYLREMIESMGDVPRKKAPERGDKPGFRLLGCADPDHNACLPECLVNRSSPIQRCEFDDPLIVLDRFE